jgi:hypothetical protein
MRRYLSLITILTMVLSLALHIGLASAAQQNTFVKASSKHKHQEVGDTISIPDIDGNEIGTVVISDFQENFSDFSERKQSDLQYVSIGLTIENTSKDPIPVEPGNMALVDDQGLIYSDIDVTRDDNADEIESGEVAPRDTLEGYLEIGFPKEREINQLIWVVGQGQLPTLLNNQDPVQAGDAVTLYDQDYNEEATITADKVTIGFDDFAPDLTIQDGYQVIGARVTIENTGTEDFTPDPTSFFIATTDGVFWVPDNSIVRSDKAISKVPDLTNDPIAAGDSVTGFLTYSVLDTETVDYIFYLPDGFRLVRLYDNPDASSDDSTPAAGDDDNGKDGGDLGPLGGKKTPTAADDSDVTPSARKTPTPSGDDCAGASDYQDATLANLQAWSDALSSVDFQNIQKADPADISGIADDVRAIARDQKNLDVPPAAEDFNKLLAGSFTDTASALDDLADAVDAGDATGIGTAAKQISDIGASFGEGDVADALTDLKDACPDIDQL